MEVANALASRPSEQVRCGERRLHVQRRGNRVGLIFAYLTSSPVTRPITSRTSPATCDFRHREAGTA